MRWNAASINSLPPQKRSRILDGLTPDEAALLLRHWPFWARPSQLPPPKTAAGGDWRIWLFLGGRGAGKTRAGAEWIAAQVRGGRARRIGLIGATARDARQVMVEGESGLLAVADGLTFQPSNNLLRWPDGADRGPDLGGGRRPGASRSGIARARCRGRVRRRHGPTPPRTPRAPDTGWRRLPDLAPPRSPRRIGLEPVHLLLVADVGDDHVDLVIIKPGHWCHVAELPVMRR